MENQDIFKTVVLCESEVERRTVHHIRGILDQVNKVRQTKHISVIESSLATIEIASRTDEPLDSTEVESHALNIAVLICEDSRKSRENSIRNSWLGTRRPSELGSGLDVDRFCFPSARLSSRSGPKTGRIENINITVISSISNYLKVPYGKETPLANANDLTKLESLGRWLVAYINRSVESKIVRIIESEEDDARQPESRPSWSTRVFRKLQTLAPQLTLIRTPLQEALDLVETDIESLNGFLVAECEAARLLSNRLSLATRCPQIPATVYTASSSTDNSAKLGELSGIYRILHTTTKDGPEPASVSAIQAVCHMLDYSFGLQAEANALLSALGRTLDPPELIGSDLLPIELGGPASSDMFMEEVLKNFENYLEAVNSMERATLRQLGSVSNSTVAHHRRPMSLIEKILAHHAIGLSKPDVSPGDMICVSVDWTITSELLWAGMEKTYDAIKRPRLHRNDRVWLAVDHTVDPRTNNRPRQKALIHKAESFRQEAKIIDFLPANTSIMHTDFTRERVQPGYLVVGSDSHTCSAGSMGALAVGFGAADVVMPLVTGETWFRVPEICRINFVGKLPHGISGKDVILHILGLFKRNTIAFQRAVEYGGPALSELSMDARFAVANMTTEFGGMGACFESDELTTAWLADRRLSKDKNRALYFKPDPGAQYAEVRTIDLSRVEVTIAIYPNPDDVVPISTKEGMKLDGCFIGACTTTEEELIMAGLVLEAGLKLGMRPTARGKRRVTPGSLLIVRTLEKLGLLEVYREAGFGIGAPGCSYCVGINDVDVAKPGEVWLSSQNRNFRNRMGRGGIGNVSCASAVAASSFNMEVTDPRLLMMAVDLDRYRRLVSDAQPKTKILPSFREPDLDVQSNAQATIFHGSGDDSQVRRNDVILSKIQRFGENIDTDAIIPAEFMPGVDDKDLGSHCFEYFRPDFRQRASAGAQVIVAENGFGSGSSREDAVRALKGAGVQMVIAKSFAFIYERNQLNMGLFSARILDDDFYTHAREGATLTIDKNEKTLKIEGVDRVWTYEHSAVEAKLLRAGGILELYKIHGDSLFRHLTREETQNTRWDAQVRESTMGLEFSKSQDSLSW